MKTLTLLLLLCFVSCKAQLNNEYPIPTMFQGVWVNALGTDSIIVTEDTITWSDGNEPIVVCPDVLIDNTSTLFAFSSRPEAFRVSLKKLSKIKIVFTLKTADALGIFSRTYLKVTRVNQEQ